MSSGGSEASAKKTRKDVLRDFRQGQIVDAAWRVIGEKGYTEASVDLIAERAGISKSTLYVYFDSKEEILSACFATGQRLLIEGIDRSVAEADGVEDQLTALIEATLLHFDEHGLFFGAIVSQAHIEYPHRQVGGRALVSLSKEFGTRLVAVLERGLARGELREHDVKESAIVIGTLLYGTVGLRARREALVESAADSAVMLARYVLRGILAP